ncbi:MAG: ATP-binding cassette domain-containing protein [Chthonomonas sp.]|nr:ATP-binding cassette domain-containing protein [Chthonomonas sp.]
MSKNFADPKKGVVRAVQDVSFVAKPGQTFGLLGANGAGKTTTLRMLSTVIQPTSGSATVNGFDVVRDSRSVRANIGFLSTSTALYQRLNPVEMLRYFGELYGMSKADTERRIEEIVAKLNIGEFMDRLCDKLSTGQKQRVSIARAILHDPPILFFDEPTAGLDVVTSQTILEFIEDCRNSGKTVIFSTHIMAETERLCDHVAVIHEGKMRAQGTVEGLKAEYQAESFEQAFLKIVDYRSEVNA